MGIARDIESLKESLRLSERMPVVFLGHGSPMNAIEDNQYSRNWKALGEALPRPQAILVVSAHWMTRGATLVDISPKPRTIHDFYGFPPALYEQQYPASGAPELASDVAFILAEHKVKTDDSWGLDHGAWSVLKWLYPDFDIPVFQLSIDMNADLRWHFETGQKLAELRDRGVLILGSGNVVHNLRALNAENKVYDWAEAFDKQFAGFLEDGNFRALAAPESFAGAFALAHPSPDHYIPALTVAGAVREGDNLAFTNAQMELASISMRSFVFY